MSDNIKRLKRAIEQIDEAQPLCPSLECDKLADAAMNIDLVVSELEASKPPTPPTTPPTECVDTEPTGSVSGVSGGAAGREKRGNPDDLPVIDSFNEGDPMCNPSKRREGHNKLVYNKQRRTILSRCLKCGFEGDPNLTHTCNQSKP